MCGKPHADLIIRGRMTQADYGIGIYTAPEAARLVGMGAQTLRRWLLGYDHKDKDAQVRHEPALWRPQYDPEEADGVLLGFRDLIETRIVNAPRTKRIGLPPIRICMHRAREHVGQDHPVYRSAERREGTEG